MTTERHHRRVSVRLSRIADQIEQLRKIQRKCQSRIDARESVEIVNKSRESMVKCSAQIHELTLRAEQLRKSLEPVEAETEVSLPCKRSGIKYSVGRLA